MKEPTCYKKDKMVRKRQEKLISKREKEFGEGESRKRGPGLTTWFLVSLYDLVANEGTDEVVHWNPDGDHNSFVIADQA